MHQLRRKCAGILALFFAVVAFAGAASAQVNLTSPTAAELVGSNISMAGNGYPTGTITASSVTITVVPSPGNGSPVSFAPTTISGSGSNRTLIFKLPASLSANQPYTATITISGQTTANAAFTTATPATITINPAGSISNVSPGAGQVGTAVNVIIAGLYTHFAQATSLVTVGGTGVTVSNMVVTPGSTTQLTATFTIAANATPGAYPVTVTSGSEVATLAVGFVVSASPGLSFATIAPNSAQLNQTLNVTVTGINTHFAQGTTFANFGDGITVNSLSSFTPTSFVANLTVSATTETGWRMVTAVTGGEYAVSTAQGFDVTPSIATLMSVAPNTASQSTNITNLVVTGLNTHFLQNATTLSMGSGINVGNIQVTSPTTLIANVSVGPSATVGAHDVTATTGGETETLSGGFTVTSTTPFLSNVSPTSGAQGTTVAVNVTGVNTNFTLGTITADFGSNITTSVVVNSATSLTINASIALLASTGGRTAILHDNGTDFSFSFTVTASPAQIISVSPSSGPQGGTPTITITGQNTHWVQGTTTATITCCVPGYSVTVNEITVNSPTSLVLNLTIPANDPPAAYTLTLSTGGEVVSSTFSVFANTPTLSIAPGSGQIGTTVPVTLVGQFTSWQQGTTTLNIDGQGVTITDFTVLTPVTATANFVIDPAAIPSQCSPTPIECHTVTVTTGTQIVTTTFLVTSTPAVIISISPEDSPQSNALNVTVTGMYTHFVQGTTTLSFGPDVTVATPITVSSPTQLSANITVDDMAAYGWRIAFVNTGAEQLQAPFLIDSPSPALGGVVNLSGGGIAPAHGFQGETITGVLIEGSNTHWQQGVTQLIVGAGITINSLTVQSPTVMTTNVVISPTAPIGNNVFVAITGSEVATGTGVEVLQGPAQILSVTPNVVTQNQTVTLTIVGQATHWLQGGTNLTFGGGGIAVDQLTIIDATDATAQITVLSQAATGFQSVNLTTSGEIASIGQGLDVEQGTPTLLSSIPNTGLQGVTENIQVLGQFTHWVQGTTQAAYSPGVTVNSVTVMDSVTATLNITVDPLAYVDSCPPFPYCRTLTVTTGTEQVSLPYQFSVLPGPAQLTSLSPGSTPQGSTVTIHVVGQNTHFENGVTTANFGSGTNVSNVSVTSATTADVEVAATVNAPTGFQTVTLSTLGENASIQNAFTITPGVPTLNGVSPVSAEQGVTTTLHVISQFTHWQQDVTTATFGQGITLNSLTIDDSQTADANVTIDPLAYTGGRMVTFTTNTEIVSGSLFSVIPGPAIISGISPSTGNQGQEIVFNITGQSTHWLQGLTQFSMSGSGYDITVNAFIVNSPTSATADITISPTATLGARSIYISTAGEVLTNPGAFVVTGGVPCIANLSPSLGVQGNTGLNVTINGCYTQWLTNGANVAFGPGVTITQVTVNDDTSITAVINIDPNAPLGYQTVTVRSGSQALTSSFAIYSSTIIPGNPFSAPAPYISYFYPSVGLPGQTFNVTILGQYPGHYTSWDTTTQITFGAGIAVNTFQTVTPTSALANITIDPAATQGVRTVTLTTATNGEIDTAYFNVVFATPSISIVDSPSALQGEPGKNINIIGQYTTWNDTTVFNFGSGVHVSNTMVLGPTVATVTISVDQLATLGGRQVTATTGSEVDTGAGFSVTPSLANISSITPNTALQNATPTVSVVGQFTHWDTTTTFSFDGFGISVTGQTFVDATHYTLTLALDPLATVGTHGITATTAGEVATLANAFVVQPGTPLILSSGPPTIQQQNSLNATIVGQFTQWTQAGTTVSFGANSGIVVNSTTVTGTEAITANISAAATTPLGYRTLYVTTGSQVLTLPNAIYVTNGPAAITMLTPSQGPQGATSYNVAVLGTNTNFVNGITTANFGQGIGVNSVTVTDTAHATVNVNIATNAVPGFNSVSLTTAGETAVGTNAFQIVAATPVLLSVSPGSGKQGDTGDSVAVIGGFTHFQQGNTTASFGAGTTGTVAVTDATHATVSLNISPTAVTGSRAVNLTTNLGGGNQEIAVWANNFQINPGSAAISLLSPNSGNQNQNGLQVTITGTGTHFDNTSTVNFGQGITAAVVQQQSATSIQATINIDPAASIGTRSVSVTTGGEIASITNGFTVNAGLPVITTVAPNTAHQGDTISVQLTGLYTTFQQGTTTASFGAGITTNGAVTVTDGTHATANISITTGAATGARTVALTTGTQAASDVGGFTVLAGLPQISSLTPSSGGQSSTETVIINGLFTNFQQGVSQVAIAGGGITFGTITVNGPTTLSVPVVISAGAALGQRAVTVTTGSEVATSATVLFNVQQGINLITQISPNTAVPSQTVPVTITGQSTNWVQGTTTATFSPDLQVGGAAAGTPGPVTITSPTSLIASVTIPANAPLGPRNVTVQTGASVQNVVNGFTVQLNDTTAPTVTSTSPAPSATSVSLNTAISITFSKPINPATLLTNATTTASPGNVDVVLYDTTTGQYIGGAITLDASGRIGTFVPSQLLAVNRQYQFVLNGGTATITDTVTPTANPLTEYSFYFTTGFGIDTTGPALISSNIYNGDTGIALNAPVVLLFSTPVNPVTQPNGIFVQTGVPGVNILGTYTFDTTNTIVTFTPLGTLLPSTAYTVLYTAQLTDSAGNPLSNPGSFTYTTGTAADNGPGPTIISYSPGSGETNVATNAAITLSFNKPVNPISINSTDFRLVNANTGIMVPAAISFSPDNLTTTLTPNSPLTPFDEYYFQLYGYTDVAGNAGNYYSTTCGYYYYYYCYFTTGAGTDTVAPTVTTISPTSGITGVAVNAYVVAVLSKPIDATSVNNSSITLTQTSPAGPAVTGTVTLASDQVTMTFTPTAVLSPSTTYSVQVSGFRGVDGTPVTTFNSTFATSSSSTPDTTNPSVTSYTPASGSTQPENTTITLNIDKPMNPASFVSSTSSSFLSSPSVVSNVNGLQTEVVGSVTVTNTVSGSTVVFTPSSPLTAGATISVCGTCSVDPTDFAGNGLLGGTSWSFTVTGAVDTTPPTVTSITPPNGATSVGQNTPIVITFSKPLNPNTINNTTFGVFNGDSQISTSITRSADSTTVTLTQTLPSSALITVAITHGVTDLIGNQLADYSSQFNSAAVPPTGHPSVITIRPGYGATGVDPASPITLITNTPLNPSTVPGALHVSQNGVIVAGSLQFSANNQTILFTPGASFTPGALVQIFFDTTATDTYGNSLNSYNAQFTVAPSLTGVGPTVSALSPYYGAYISISNPVVDIQFTKPIAPATVTAANFFLLRNDTGNPIAATVSQLSPNVVRITPTTALDPTSQPLYRINISASVTDTSNNPYTGPTASYYFYVYSTAAPDTVNPTVTALAPPNGSTNVGDNALFRIQFSKPIDPLSVTQNTILISGGSYTVMPSSIAFDSLNQTVTITPQTPLPDGTQMTIAINGVTDPSGNAVVPVTAQFTTANGPDTTQPTVISSSVDNGVTNVPVNSVFTVVFSKPMDTRLLNGTNFALYDQNYGVYLPANISFTPDGLSGTINPTSALPVGRSIALNVANAQDITGNTMVAFSVSFTTSFTANTVPPAVTFVSPFNGATGVPINAQIQIEFTESLQATSLSQVTLTGSALTTMVALSSGDEVLTLTPNTLLQPNTTYTLTIAGVKDTSGNTIASTVTSTFTTGPGADLSATVSVLSYSPGSYETNVGTNAVVTARFSKPINPISINASTFNLVNSNTGAVIPSTTSISPDRLTATLTPNSPLTPYTQFYFTLYGYTDMVGNTGGTCYSYYYYYYYYPCHFTTGAGTDSVAPTVTTISPTNGITGVAVNAYVVAVLSKPIDPTSVNNSSITLTPTSPAGPAVTGAVTLASDQVTMTFTPTAVLSPSTTYSVQVSGFRGVDGTPVTTFNSTFATNSSSTPDTTPPSITSYTPANGSTQPENTTITANINKPMNPASFVADTGNDSVYVQSCATVCAFLPGSLTVTNTTSSSTVVFTPSNPLTAGATITVGFCYNFCPKDFAGNALGGINWSFTVSGAADTTPPTVTSITPPSGTSGVGQNTPVVITFSKPLNPNTIGNSTFALFNGGTELNTGITRSADNRTVTLSSTFAGSSTITAGITSGVTDLSGNQLAPYTSQFTTAAVPPTGNFSIVTQRPGSGATGVPANTPVYLVANRQVNPSTIQSALHVSQNGVIVSGTASVSANGEAILFTPAANLANNAVVQVFLDTTATDIYGNPANYYSGAFTTAADQTGVGPTVAALSPYSGAYISISNPVVDIQFTKPIAAATITSANFFLLMNDGGSPITATLSQPAPNVVRIAPTSPLDPTNQPYYRINISASVTDTDGNAYTGPTASYYFYVYSAAVPDTNVPTITAVVPPQGSTVGDNALINVTFSKPMDPISINASTVTVNGGVVPASFNFNNNNTNVVVTPLAPLPDGANLTLTLTGVPAGIIDPSGNPVNSQTIQFSTLNGPDITQPQVISSSVDSGETIPQNAVFSVTFNEPMNTATLLSGFYLYDNSLGYLPVSRSFSADGTTAYINPTSPLTPGDTIQFTVYYGQDLSGNTQVNYSIDVIVSSSVVTAPPTVLATNPGVGQTSAVPVNTQLQVLFNESVQGSSLSQITLTGGPAITLTPSLTNGDQTVQLIPNVTLAPNTTYTLAIQGVQSTAGVAMAGSVTVTFTTGPSVSLTGPTVTAENPLNGATAVPASVTPTVGFSEPINSLTTYSYVYLTLASTNAVVPSTLSYSADYMTVTITPTAPLSSATQYNLYVGGSNITDEAGNAIQTGATVYTFTTQ